MALPTSQFSIPTNVWFGHGEVSRIGECLEFIEATNPLLLTDAAMLQTSAYEKIRSALEGCGKTWALFDGVSPNPTEADANKATIRFREGRHDALIGFGGGSAIDCAKAVAVRLAYEGPLEEYQPPARPETPLTPVIAIPTTAGTGSEVGRASVIVLEQTGQKTILFDPRLMPRVALIDPELTYDLPAKLTAATGMDAFTHCIESYVSPVFHPVADAIALGGLELVIENLPRAVRDGHDTDARGYMMIAAMMGALAFQKDLGSAHAMAHPLSTISGLHHGLANAIVLPYVMAFNRSVVKEKYARVATLFDPGSVRLDPDEGSKRAIRSVTRLNEDIGIPTDLKTAGVREEDLPALAEAASQDACRLTNPRTTELVDFQNLFRNAFEGILEVV